MNDGSSLPYRLRPNKAADRELFVALLIRLAPILKLENYEYVGLGGSFLEDFRLVHARLGITNMVCVEAEESVHKRQEFNRPIETVDCVHSTLEDYIDGRDFDVPLIMWMDYSNGKQMASQIERFAQSAGVVPAGSILRLTLNASPSSLGKPDHGETTVQAGERSTDLGSKPTLQEWRLERLRTRLGVLFPSDTGPEHMTTREYGGSVLRAVMLAVERGSLSHRDRKYVWALSTHYADGQPMVTAAVVVCDPSDALTAEIVRSWEFYSTPGTPLVLDMPVLSTLERLRMESSRDPRSTLGFELPKSDMGDDPFAAFKKFYRIYPHFSKVEF